MLGSLTDFISGSFSQLGGVSLAKTIENIVLLYMYVCAIILLTANIRCSVCNAGKDVSRLTFPMLEQEVRKIVLGLQRNGWQFSVADVTALASHAARTHTHLLPSTQTKVLTKPASLRSVNDQYVS